MTRMDAGKSSGFLVMACYVTGFAFFFVLGLGGALFVLDLLGWLPKGGN